MALAKFLVQTSAPVPPPRARRWQDEGLRPHDCKFVRARQGLAFAPAQLHVALQGGPTARHDVVLWDAELNAWLVGARCRAVNPTNEAERFAYVLQERFAPLEQRYGDGFFNAVLIHHLRTDEEIAGSDPVRAVLRAIHVPRPSRSRAATDCSEAVDSVLGTCGRDLVSGLGYQERQAGEILCSAIAQFLDERFSITNARLLGL